MFREHHVSIGFCERSRIMSFLKQYLTFELIVLLWGDVFLGIAAFYLTLLLPMGKIFGKLIHDNFALPQAESGVFVFVFSLLICSFLVALYKQEKEFSKRKLLFRVLTNVALSFFLLSGLFYMLPPVVSGRTILVISLLSFGLFQWTWHILCVSIWTSTHVSKRVLILGAGTKANLLGSLIRSGNRKYELIGYVGSDSEPTAVPMDSKLCECDGLVDLVKKVKPHILVISFTERRGILPIQEILTAKMNGIKVYDAPSFYELMTGKLPIEHIDPSWLFFGDGFRNTIVTKVYKAISDRLIAVLGLAASSPVLLLIALIIKLESPGPVIFRQTRVGRKERPFTIYKFRTMVQDAEKESGPQWAKKNDPRITNFGAFLRKVRLDELPQLYNVLKGDLSIVGPRPERPNFVQELQKIIPYYCKRHFTTPGITGWAQINYPYGDSVEDAAEKLRYDLYYMKHMSIWLDLFIILETFNVILFGKGGR